MNEITTESEWFACMSLWHLGRCANKKIDPRRFRWLAAEWGAHIRDSLTEEDQLWFDAFDGWVNEAGRNPSEVESLQSIRHTYYPGGIFMEMMKNGAFHK